MTHEVGRPQRRSIRLREYDYAQAGAYFVTIVTKDRACVFGEIVGGVMRPNQFGCIVAATWNALPDHYPGVECDGFVLMPNHVHGIIVLTDNDGRVNDVGAGFKPARAEFAPTATARTGFKPAPTGLSEIVRGFKTFSARRINQMRATPGVPVWQRNYYDHVVRGEKELNRIREYIANNPLQWEMDRENPNRAAIKSVAKVDPWEI